MNLKYLRFRLRLSLSVIGRMAIRRNFQGGSFRGGGCLLQIFRRGGLLQIFGGGGLLQIFGGGLSDPNFRGGGGLLQIFGGGV